ncbi:MAG: WYL domain-containing protein [Lachnospiraceae bacterium]|nr:WYL domain-containing protein [Lachnospiraceae bacterium]
MIFSELYSAYYNAVADIIRTALDHPVQKGELRRIVEKHAFGESVLSIEPAILEERWQIIKPDGTTNIRLAPQMPLTTIQKRWLKAVLLDPRVRLFLDDTDILPDVEPLFTKDDYTIFDKYADGDDYEDEAYRQRFRLIMDAIRNEYPIRIEMNNRHGRRVQRILMPKYLEYSEKDDKFRLIASGKTFNGIFNLGRILSCERFHGDCNTGDHTEVIPVMDSVVFELYDRRNALERVLLHFAHFEKEAERIGKDSYRVTIRYDKDDETEIVIRLLSFGPMVKVIEPEPFVDLIKKRLIAQKSCGL